MGRAQSTWTVLNVGAELSPESIHPGEEPWEGQCERMLSHSRFA